MRNGMTVLFFVVSAASSVFSQAFEGIETLKKMQRLYQGENSFEMTLEYEYSSKQEVLQTLAAEIKVDGALYYSKLGNQESVNTAKCFIHIDHDHQIINVYQPRKDKVGDLVKLPLDSSLKGVESIKADTINGQGRLQVKYKPGQKADQMDIEYDLKTYHIRSATFSLNDEDDNPVQLKITFKSFSTKITGRSEAFDHQRILLFKGENIFPAEQFKTYEINNYLNLNE